MAEGFARQYGQGQVDGHSAGIAPSRLNLLVHGPLEDPAAATGTPADIRAKFREIRDVLETRVAELLRRARPDHGAGA
jgi:hypothetical protein